MQHGLVEFVDDRAVVDEEGCTEPEPHVQSRSYHIIPVRVQSKSSRDTRKAMTREQHEHAVVEVYDEKRETGKAK